MALGRPCIFGDKSDGARIQGVLTKRGGQEFEWLRQELAALYKRIVGREAAAISDADVVEWQIRGEQETVAALEALKARQNVATPGSGREPLPGAPERHGLARP